MKLTRPSGPVRFFQLIAGEKKRSVRFSVSSPEVKSSIRPSAAPLEAATAFSPACAMRLWLCSSHVHATGSRASSSS